MMWQIVWDLEVRIQLPKGEDYFFVKKIMTNQITKIFEIMKEYFVIVVLYSIPISETERLNGRGGGLS